MSQLRYYDQVEEKPRITRGSIVTASYGVAERKRRCPQCGKVVVVRDDGRFAVHFIFSDATGWSACKLSDEDA